MDSRLNFIKKKQPCATVIYNGIQQPVIISAERREAYIIKVQVKIGPSQLLNELAQQRAFAAAPDSTNYKRVALNIRQFRQELALKPQFLFFQRRFLSGAYLPYL
jgi:hypothetical protein